MITDIILSIIGFSVFLYGKNIRSPFYLSIGGAFMMIPYFFDSWSSALIACGVVVGGGVILKRYL